MRITDYFNRILEKQKEMGYYFPEIIQPPATNQQIQNTEEKLGFKFNDELIELYSYANGTLTDNNTPCGKTGLIPIHSFLSLEDAIRYYKRRIEQEELFKNLGTNYQPGKNLFPFLEDGAGNCHWVDLNRGENYGRIYETNTFGSEPDYLYNSLTSLFQVIYECYAQRIFTLEQEGFLECDYEKFGEVSRKYNPNIEYWTRY